MKRLKTTLFVIVILSTLVFTESCRKNKEFKKEDGAISEDNKNIQSNIDNVVNEANQVLSGSYSGKTQIPGAYGDSICGATVDTSLRSQGIITIVFDGSTNCYNRKRSGSVKLTLQGYATGKRWSDVNAVLTIDYIDYKVTRVNDNISLTFNGTNNLTNTSGGNVITLLFGMQNQLIHDVNGSNLIVKFDDQTTSTFNISRRYTHTWTNPVYQIKGEGTGTQNNISNLENWGVTKDGDNFTSQVTEPVIWNTTCGAHKPVAGKMEIIVDAKEFSFITTIGVDASGNVVNSGCPWGLKVEWTYKNNTGSHLYQYH
ncbi:MAG: hypothetical protein H0V01_11975 [Bacteroidetes bacterium]|nr:hypothetical protein [Bacteroidota bacterium]HET6245200.1 hypothetical protein [Bacteroidia bacterium]